MSGEGWVVVYTDGSAKRVRGWMQAGYGVWFGDNSSRDFRAHVPAHERQSISRGELHIDWLRGEAGDKLQVRWVPSHLGVEMRRPTN